MDRELRGARVGVALTGSFCTFASTLQVIGQLKAEGCELYPILSYHAYDLDTRFYRAEDLRGDLTALCERPIWHTIQDVEPIGPKKLLDLILVLPCTGNTLSKLARGIADTPVTMACKSQLRNDRPILVGVSTNDGLAGNAESIGRLMGRRNYYFIPFGQDDPDGKPASLVARMEDGVKAARYALNGIQMQPLLK